MANSTPSFAAMLRKSTKNTVDEVKAASSLAQEIMNRPKQGGLKAALEQPATMQTTQRPPVTINQPSHPQQPQQSAIDKQIAEVQNTVISSNEIDNLQSALSTLRTALESVAGDLPTVLNDTLSYLQSHPETKAQLLPDDVALMVSALRATYVRVVEVKAAKQTKKKVTSAKVSEVADELSGLGF